MATRDKRDKELVAEAERITRERERLEAETRRQAREDAAKLKRRYYH